MKIFKVLIVGFVLIFSMPTYALSNQGGFSQSNQSGIVASNNSLFVATTGEVTLTFLSSDASYSSNLFLVGDNDVLFNNKTVMPFQTLTGFFEAGTELIFKLHVNNTGHDFYNGAAQRNADHFIHAGYKVLTNQSLIVGFEDLFNGGDRDYNDVVFLLNNVTLTKPITPVPEPESYAMIVAGLALIGFSAKRKKN